MQTKKPTSLSGAEAKWSQHQDDLKRIAEFTVQARVASGGLLGFRGDLRWEQTGPQFAIRFSGPFGVGATSLTGTEDNVEIRTRRNTYQTDDPEGFLADKVGFTMPVKGLRYWVLGLPSPHSKPRVTLDDAGRLATLEQDGWTVTYTDYDAVSQYDLPAKIEMKGAKTSFRIVIDSWTGLAAAKG